MSAEDQAGDRRPQQAASTATAPIALSARFDTCARFLPKWSLTHARGKVRKSLTAFD